MIRYLAGLVLALALGVMGCSETSGAGGTAGNGGVGGTAGGEPQTCQPYPNWCVRSVVADVVEMCEAGIPNQPSACRGSESVVNPASCDATGAPETFQLTRMRVAGDCGVGFDLDSCDGASCNALLYSLDDLAGLDNALGRLNWFAREFSNFNCPDMLVHIDQALHDAICLGDLDIEIDVAINSEEGCALMMVSVGGTSLTPVPMNLSPYGCLSGTLGTLPLAFGSFEGVVENAVVRMTVSADGFSDGFLGGTIDKATAAKLINVAAEDSCGVEFVLDALLDINADMSGESSTPCDSMSLTLEVGGSTVP